MLWKTLVSKAAKGIILSYISYHTVVQSSMSDFGPVGFEMVKHKPKEGGPASFSFLALINRKLWAG